MLYILNLNWDLVEKMILLHLFFLKNIIIVGKKLLDEENWIKLRQHCFVRGTIASSILTCRKEGNRLILTIVTTQNVNLRSDLRTPMMVTDGGQCR